MHVNLWASMPEQYWASEQKQLKCKKLKSKQRQKAYKKRTLKPRA